MKPKHVLIGGIALLVLLSLPLLSQMGGNYGPPVTAAKYDQIQISSSFQDVERLLGRPGIKTNMTIEQAMEQKDVFGTLYGRMGRNFEVYAWKNKKGKASGDDVRIFVMFTDNKVVAKKQIGLE